MEYKVYDEKSYRIHTIKSNRYKTTLIDIVFQNKATFENVYLFSFLAELLNCSCKKYPTYRELEIAKEELYSISTNFVNYRQGEVNRTILSSTFINPEFIEEKDYLNNVFKFLFEIILNPNVCNGEFDKKSFDIVKKDIILDIESAQENAMRKALENASELYGEDTMMACKLLGTKEDVEKITPESIYKTYTELINESVVDIFVIGNTNMDDIVSLIKYYYKNNRIRNQDFINAVNPKLRKKPIIKEEQGNFEQTQLVALFNTTNLTLVEKYVTFHVLNYILGSGGLSSKLYRYIREEKGYCYRISSMFFNIDNTFAITSSLAKENVQNVIKLIKKTLKEMQNGEFSEDDLRDAIHNMQSSLKVNKTNRYTILNVYESQVFSGALSLEEKEKYLCKITKEDVIKVAKKIKENTYYILCEAQDGRN